MMKKQGLLFLFACVLFACKEETKIDALTSYKDLKKIEGNWQLNNQIQTWSVQDHTLLGSTLMKMANEKDSLLQLHKIEPVNGTMTYELTDFSAQLPLTTHYNLVKRKGATFYFLRDDMNETISLELNKASLDYENFDHIDSSKKSKTFKRQ